MDYTGFLSWIRQNVVLLEYFYEELCPLQWLSHGTVQKLLLQQATSTRQDPLLVHLDTNSQLMITQQPVQHQPSFASVYFDTDRSLSPIISEDKGENVKETTKLRRKSKSMVCRCEFCCCSCRNSKHAQSEVYAFEK